MAEKSSVNVAGIAKIFEKIGGEIEPHTDPKLGAFLVRLVKDHLEFERFKARPEETLRHAGLNPRLVKPELLLIVAESVARRVAALVPAGIVMDTISSSESSSHQDRNFDNSSSWFMNKDGYNVMHDAGHSSEQSTGQIAGSDNKFSGFGIADYGDVIRQELISLFYPAQRLVTPALVDKIKAAAKDIET